MVLTLWPRVWSLPTRAIPIRSSASPFHNPWNTTKHQQPNHQLEERQGYSFKICFGYSVLVLFILHMYDTPSKELLHFRCFDAMYCSWPTSNGDRNPVGFASYVLDRNCNDTGCWRRYYDRMESTHFQKERWVQRSPYLRPSHSGWLGDFWIVNAYLCSSLRRVLAENKSNNKGWTLLTEFSLFSCH